jgi:hypothetical protein
MLPSTWQWAGIAFVPATFATLVMVEPFGATAEIPAVAHSTTDLSFSNRTLTDDGYRGDGER